jgi:microcystin-dependent protein
MSIKFIQLPTCKLAEFINSTATEFDVSGFLYNDGVTPVDPADIGDICFATLEPKTAREELISFTIESVTAGGVATITAVRGLSQKSPYGTGGAAFDHQNGSDLVISNNPGLFNKLAVKANDETVTGSWQFPEVPTHNNNPVTKKYFDDTGVKLTGNQTVAGIKTFSSSPILPASTTDTQAIRHDQVVRLADNQTVAGVKTFSSSPVVPTATTATQAVNKAQVESYVAANSGDIKASDSAFGTVKLSHPAENITEPTAVTYTTKIGNFISATIGMISLYAGSSAPPGFLLCDGEAVSRTTYSDLFAVVGTSFGAGDGSTTFNLPDLAGRVPIGQGRQSVMTVDITEADISVNQFTYSSTNATANTIGGISGNLPVLGEQVVVDVTQYGLTAGVIYYAIPVGSSLALATSYANAVAGTRVNINTTTSFTARSARGGARFTVSDKWGDIKNGSRVVLTTAGTLPANIPAGTYYIRLTNTAGVIMLESSEAVALLGRGGLNASTTGTGTSTLVISNLANTFAEKGGQSQHTLTEAEIPSHNHPFFAQSSSTGSQSSLSGGLDTTSTVSSSSNDHIGYTGGSQPHENIPPYLVINYIIKT